MSLMLSGWKYLEDFGSLPDPLKRNGRYTASDTVCEAGVEDIAQDKANLSTLKVWRRQT